MYYHDKIKQYLSFLQTCGLKVPPQRVHLFSW